MYNIQVLGVTNWAGLWYNMGRRWGECYESVTSTSAGEVSKPDVRAPPTRVPASRVYIRAGQAGSWKLDIHISELEAGSCSELGPWRAASCE